jgi:hypothetical protein
MTAYLLLMLPIVLATLVPPVLILFGALFKLRSNRGGES